jgi:hypothetical protein
MARYLPRRTFGLVLTVLAIGTVAGVAAVVLLHRVTLVPVVVGAAVAIGVVYIVVFARPEPEPLPPPPGPPVDPSTPPVTGSPPAPTAPPEVLLPPTEPYEPDFDPVEEADRLDTEKSRGELPTSEGQDPK